MKLGFYPLYHNLQLQWKVRNVVLWRWTKYIFQLKETRLPRKRSRGRSMMRRGKPQTHECMIPKKNLGKEMRKIENKNRNRKEYKQLPILLNDPTKAGEFIPWHISDSTSALKKGETLTTLFSNTNAQVLSELSKIRITYTKCPRKWEI